MWQQCKHIICHKAIDIKEVDNHTQWHVFELGLYSSELICLEGNIKAENEY